MVYAKSFHGWEGNGVDGLHRAVRKAFLKERKPMDEKELFLLEEEEGEEGIF